MERFPVKPPTIFVSIVAYNDSLLWNTVADCILKATYPEALTIAVIDQSTSPKTDGIPDQVKYVHLDAKFGRGPCWARSLALSLCENEDYVLQIDSHSLFDTGWDEYVVYMIEGLKKRSPKPMLSNYPCPFDLVPDGFTKRPSPDCALVMRPREGAEITEDNPAFGLVAVPTKTDIPILGFHVGGGFIFAPRKLFLEVPYDPALYFLGEEHDIAIRAWTNGWDIYHAPEVPIYHLYNDKETNTKPRVLHWDAAEDEKRKVRWWQHNERSKARLRAMLYEGADLGVYGLGTQRSLQEFAEFSGIDYLNRVINR
jgi:hypothetical protein